MRTFLLILLLRHSLALVAPAANPRALSALTDEVLDVAQWVGTNADQLPIGEYAPFAAAGAAAGAMAVSGAAVLRSFERDAPVESPLSKDGRYDPEAADAYFGRRPVHNILHLVDLILLLESPKIPIRSTGIDMTWAWELMDLM